MTDETTEELLPRAEIFRSKLIEGFRLLDVLGTEGQIEGPKLYSNEISDNADIMDGMMRDCPQSLIKFRLRPNRPEKTEADRQLNRLETRNHIPLGPWAAMVVSNNKCQNFLLGLIIVNSIILGVYAEIDESKDPNYVYFKLLLDIIDYISLVIFALEILLKWIAGFWEFWKNGWNIFDFIVTVMSFLPELIGHVRGKDNTTQSVGVLADHLRVFRILRSLKMVSRFAQLRMIVLTILKSFKSMAFILILLMTIMYVFAVAGTVMFSDYSKSSREDLKYKDGFSTLIQTFITLFQLFTLDHWYDILQDLMKVTDDLSTKIYVILWICIGAFIFRNVFAGIMVMNFQNIQNDFAAESQEEARREKDEQMKTALEEKLARQYLMHRSSRRFNFVRLSIGSKRGLFTSPSVPMGTIYEDGMSQEDQNETLSKLSNENPREKSSVKAVEDSSLDEERKGISSEVISSPHQSWAKDLPRAEARIFRKTTKLNLDDPQTFEKVCRLSEEWNHTVRGNFNNLATAKFETLWPKDLLFRYLQLMEALQDNLTERQQLQRLSAAALNHLNDR